MTVSWAEETKESRPVRSRFRQAFAIVVVANLLFPALNGILGIFFENKLAFVIWLFAAALLVSVLSYRQASDNGLSGLTGLTIAAGLYFIFATDWWRQAFSWLARGDNAMKSLAGTALLLSAVLLVGKASKFLGLVKLVSFIVPVTMVSVTLPHAWKQGSSYIQSSPAIWNHPSSNPPLRTSPFPTSPSEVPKAAVKDDFVIMAQLSVDSRLYSGSLKNSGLVQPEVLLPKGSWVLVLTELEDRSGNHWLKGMLPFEGTRFNADKSQLGFIPASNIAGRVFVRAP